MKWAPFAKGSGDQPPPLPKPQYINSCYVCQNIATIITLLVASPQSSPHKINAQFTYILGIMEIFGSCTAIAPCHGIREYGSFKTTKRD